MIGDSAVRQDHVLQHMAEMSNDDSSDYYIKFVGKEPNYQYLVCMHP